MTDAKSIINLGLGKIAASKISSLDPARSPLEKHCEAGYAVWRDSELELREWRFAIESGYALTLSATLSNRDDSRIYKYALPNDCIRPLRNKRTEWEERGRYVFSVNSTLNIDYIRRAGEHEFTALFIELMACRVAKECVEFATQSNTKMATIEGWYEDALKKAGRANAYVLAANDVTLDDQNSTWLQARFTPGLEW
jgi:hypothetical protein